MIADTGGDMRLGVGAGFVLLFVVAPVVAVAACRGRVRKRAMGAGSMSLETYDQLVAALDARCAAVDGT